MIYSQNRLLDSPRLDSFFLKMGLENLEINVFPIDYWIVFPRKWASKILSNNRFWLYTCQESFCNFDAVTHDDAVTLYPNAELLESNEDLSSVERLGKIIENVYSIKF